MAFIYGTNGHDNSDLGGADLFGTDGVDVIWGYGGDDYINGRRGHDTIYGGSGHNTIFGGEGDDAIHTEGQTGSYDGGNGIDTMHFTAIGKSGYFDLARGLGNFGAMNLTSSTTFTMANFENIHTGGGADRIYGSSVSNSISSGAGADRIWAGGGVDTVYAGRGDDIVHGEGGNDHLYGDDGNDTLDGGAGDDVLYGGWGDDILDGGESGFDTASYTTHAAAVNVDMRAGTAKSTIGGVAETDTLISIEKVVGSYHGDRLVAGATATIDGGEGDDAIYSGSGANRLVGGAGEDGLSYILSTAGVKVSLATGAASGGWAQGDSITGFENLSGSSYADTLTGNALDNDLYGNSGADVIQGGGGRDLIVGGAGADTLYGGSGADAFRFDKASDSPAGSGRHDWIMDFQVGLDKIDLRNIDANAHSSGYQPFIKFMASSNPEFTSDWTPNTINIRQTGGDTLIDLNISDDTVNAYDAPEMQIRLDGFHALSASDFLL